METWGGTGNPPDVLSDLNISVILLKAITKTSIYEH